MIILRVLFSEDKMGVGSIKCGHLDEGVFVVFLLLFFGGERRRGRWDGEG